MFFLFFGPEAFDMTAKFPHRGRVEEFVEIVRGVDPTMSVATLATFVTVANRLPQLSSGEVSLADIAAEKGVPYTSLTRQVDLLAAGAPPAVRGLHLFEKRLHSTNRRQREIGLTEQGQKLLAGLSSVFAATATDISATKPAGGARMADNAMATRRPTNRKANRKSRPEDSQDS